MPASVMRAELADPCVITQALALCALSLQTSARLFDVVLIVLEGRADVGERGLDVQLALWGSSPVWRLYWTASRPKILLLVCGSAA